MTKEGPSPYVTRWKEIKSNISEHTNICRKTCKSK